MTVSAKMKFSLNLDEALADALADVGFSPEIAKTLSFGEGIATGLIDTAYVRQLTIAASGSNSLDLAGALTSVLGQAAVFAKVRGIFILADAANTNNIIVGNGATPFLGPLGAAAHTVAVEPGELLVMTSWKNGWAVGAGASDIFKLANSGAGTGVTFKIAILGASA